ncbi:MAG: N-acetylmuramoyl-L-alanine amidase [Saprospiraceae bacterium]|nr:N-acetylmuramoyl-L-alanine amidase [Saprospiraceae bacterium]
MRQLYPLILLVLLLTSCQAYKVTQKPITFDEMRKQLTLEYLEEHYDLQQNEPTIDPKMIVVHWTIIPTMQKTFDAFNPPTLPAWRPKIKSASGLNVSSQYLIAQDGTIYQLLPDTIMARHVIGLNHCAIGIENVGGGDLPLTKAQLRSNTALIKRLAKKYPIEYLIGHYEYQSFIGHPLWKETDANYLTQKSDPSAKFMANLRRKLKHLDFKDIPE